MKYIDADKLIVEIERLRKNAWTSFQKGNSTEEQYYLRYGVIQDIISLIDSLQKEQPECVEKTARISPGLISNFGTSTFVLDVDLTQDEMAKLAPFGFNSGKIKIKIVCE